MSFIPHNIENNIPNRCGKFCLVCDCQPPQIEPQDTSNNNLVTNKMFEEILRTKIDVLKQNRRNRKDAQPGFKYKRDWYDQMLERRHLNYEYFRDNIHSILMN